MATTKHLATEHHTAAAEHHRRAASHHEKAATLHEQGKHEEAGHHANQAHGHEAHAIAHSQNAARKTSDHFDEAEHQHTPEENQQHMHQTGTPNPEVLKDPTDSYQRSTQESIQSAQRRTSTP